MDNPTIFIVIIAVVVLYAFINRSPESKARSRALKADRVKVKRKDPYLDEKIKFIHEALGKTYPTFSLTWRQKHLNKRRINNKKVNKIITAILEHLELPIKEFNVKIEKTKSPDYAGNYSHGYGIPTIKLVVNDSSTTNSILATLCHECTHHFLHEKGIWLPDTQDNEYLTDVTAIYVGFGEIIKKGYQNEKRIIDSHYEKIDDQTYSYSVQTEVSKVGYLSPGEVKYVLKKVKKLNKKYKKKS